MAYATAAQFTEAFPADVVELTNLDDACATTSIDARITEALERASSEIDSYICSVVSLPLSPLPLVLEAKALDIARYYLDYLEPRSDVLRRYEMAVEWLKAVAKGEVCLGLDTAGDEVPSETMISPVIKACDRVFTKTTLVGY